MPSAASRRGGADEIVHVDSQELRRLIVRLGDVSDRKIKAALRKSLKESADIAVQGVRDEVLKPPPPRMGKGTHPRSTGLRADIARATRASLTKGSEANGGQVSIVAANARLQPRHRGMAKAYNARHFRHPLWGNTKKWETQRGQANYFGKGVAGRREEMMRRLQAAMDDVTKNL